MGRSATTWYRRGSGFMAEPSPNHSPSGTPMNAEARPWLAGLCSITKPDNTACQPCTALPAGIMTVPLSACCTDTSSRSLSCRATGTPANQGWASMNRCADGAELSMGVIVVVREPYVQGIPLPFVNRTTGVGRHAGHAHTEPLLGVSVWRGRLPGRHRHENPRATMIVPFTTTSKEHTCWA
ncbi:hypothetical protein D3C72_1674840 [compost metagenome]